MQNGCRIVGTIKNANTISTQATIDLHVAYVQLAGTVATKTTHDIAFGSGETLLPGVYTVSAAVSLDGQGNPNSIFIFRFGGAFVTAAQSKVILINGARHWNIF